MAIDTNTLRRLRREHDELSARISKAWLDQADATFAKLASIDRNLLQKQLSVMLEYRVLLSMRIDRITEAADDEPEEQPRQIQNGTSTEASINE
jgi:hypothetical protein